MIGTLAICNGALVPRSDLTLGLDDTDVTYGYGCYETLKIRAGRLYFPEFHEERLLSSAAVLGVVHDLEPGALVAALERLAEANGVAECNVKVLLIGREGRAADWYAFLLPPIVPPASAYAEGVSCLLFRGERHFPAAKSLSMLLSTVAYRAAGRCVCYDALLVDGSGRVTEGTRTNLFYALADAPSVVYTPPADRVLSGITRRTILEACAEAGQRVEERDLSLAEAVGGGASLAVTSTSSTIIPVRRLVGERSGAGLAPTASPRFGTDSGASIETPPSPDLERLASIYGAYLERYAGPR